MFPIGPETHEIDHHPKPANEPIRPMVDTLGSASPRTLAEVIRDRQRQQERAHTARGESRYLRKSRNELSTTRVATFDAAA
jgi:hypothetical protein